MSNRKANVLIIEDDQDVLELLAFFLTQNGIEVRMSKSRDDALLAFKECVFDVVVMDLFMTGMGPTEFLDRVKSIAPKTNFILITAANRAQDEADALGIFAWLKKPFEPEDLLKKVKLCDAFNF